MSIGKREFKLEKSKDWNAWIAVIKGKAVGHQIWDKIDPSLAIKPQQIQKPQEVEEPDEDSIDDPNAYIKYKLQLTTYKAKLARWKEQHEGLSKLVDLIYDTVSVTNLTYIQKVEVHPWDLLRALRARLVPSDSARSLELERDYERLKKGPTNKQNIETWLDDYVQMYTLAKEHGIAEITNTQRTYRDFLLAIESQATVLAQMHEYLIDTATDKEQLLFEVIEKFRNHIRLREAKKTTKNTAGNSAFSAFTAPASSDKTTFRGNSAKPGPCFCGQTHWRSNCYYLNEKIRPSWWKPNQKVQEKVEEEMTEPEKKAKVERAIARDEEIQQKKKDKSSKDAKDTKEQSGTMSAFQASRASASKASSKASKDANLHGAFPIRSSFAVGGYPLRSSWILNHGSDIHVANDTMQHRFIKERDCTDGSTIAAGRELLAVAAYGKVVVNIQTPTGNKTITLLNVAYIPDFMVNIVSGSILEEKGLHFDTQHRHLHQDGQTVAFAPKVENHYVIENNTKSTANVFVGAIATSTAFKTGTAYKWHQLLAHASSEVIEHLAQAAEGVRVTDATSEAVPKTNKCEICALAKAHKLVSRSSAKAKTSFVSQKIPHILQ